MTFGWGKSRFWLAGEAGLAKRLRSALRASGRRVSLESGEALLKRPPPAGDVLLLADLPVPRTFLFSLSRCLTGRRAGRDREPLRVVLIHRADPPPALLDTPGLVVETYALEDRAARAILSRWPLHLGFDPVFGQRPHLLLAGLAPPGRALLVHALRLIPYDETRGRVSVLCEDHEAQRERFHHAYPQADAVAGIHWGPLDETGVADLAAAPPVTQILVCLADPEAGLAWARELASAVAARQGVSPPVLLEVGDAQPSGAISDWDGQIRPCAYLDLACRPEELIDGAGDRIARTIHEHYTDSIAAQGRDTDREPAGQPWEWLGGSYRDANRHQADHLWAKLALTDCRAVHEDRVEQFSFAPLEAERLALVEHLRWAADRHLGGWSYAPVRDNARKHHPQLIPYAELSGPMKDLDRFAVRGVPALLARSGLGVLRMLIAGIAVGDSHDPGGPLPHALTDPILGRLLARYPERALVLAADLGDPMVRSLVRRGVERAGAALFALHPRPIPETLAAQADAAARRDLLWLLARAERHIALPGPGETQRWLADRAEILVALGEGAALPEAKKQVHVDPPSGRLEWSFEY
jgi:hypothetical protein